MLRLEERPLPEPGPGELRLDVTLTSVNYADIKRRSGSYGETNLPFVPGLDAAGTVAALGAGVAGFRVGQRVAAYTRGGSYAEAALADARLCWALPDAVDDAAGTAIGVLVTAHMTLLRAGRFEAGEAVLVHAAAGGVGSTLVQLARALGAGRVIGTVGSAAKAAVAREAGADTVLNYREVAFDEAVLEATGGRGVDLILDAVAGPVAEAGLGCLAPFGRMVIYGHTGDGGAARIASTDLHGSNRAVIGYSSGGYRRGRPEALYEAGRAMLERVASGALRPLVSERFALADAAAAHARVESRRSVGKVLLEP